MEHSILRDILALLALSVLTVTVFRRFRLPPILGYLFVGITAGPYALGWLEHSAATQFLGEIGVVFLLFTIGLDFSLPQLKTMKGSLLGLGSVQMLIGMLSGGCIALYMGIHPAGALIVGGALAMSSTAMVMKQLTEQMELQSQHGRLALGILLFQDLAAIPLLAMIPILAGASDQSIALPLIMALLKGAVALMVILALGRGALRPLFYEIAASRSAELFTLTTLLLSLSAAWITSLLGLSYALGAFLAGMMLAETEFRHQVEIDIRPFRDVLLGLFFITVGMQLNVAQLPSAWEWILLLTLGVVIGKGGIISLLAYAAGYSKRVTVRTGLCLAQGGEFGIALLTLAAGSGLLSQTDNQLILAVIILSMTLTPLLVRHNERIATWFFGRARVRTGHAPAILDAAGKLHGHVIICGFGRTGSSIARFLRNEDIPYLALDVDPERVREGWESGDTVFYGDASHAEILRAAGLQSAVALVLSFEDLDRALRIVHAARAARHDLPILVRARDDVALERLTEAGATEGVPETLEASLMLAIQLLLLLGLPAGEIFQRINTIRSDHYRLLRGFFQKSSGMETRARDLTKEHLRTVILPAGAFAVERRLADLELEKLGVLVTVVHRRGIHEPPEPGLVLEAGDVIILHGRQSRLKRAEGHLLRGWTE